MHPAKLYKVLEQNKVQCRLCNQFCLIQPGEYGKCGVRLNKEGTLYTLVYDKIAAINVDPVEKKPLYHFKPGTQTLSLGTMGCNFACSFCQNDSLSQTPKSQHIVRGENVNPEQLLQTAIKYNTPSISYTYSEPTIFFELMHETARLAKESSLANIMVSNGFMSPDALKELEDKIDAINVDLKAFTEEFYQNYCQGRLKPVLENLEEIKKMGWWLEVTTLLIPGLNDSDDEIKKITDFIANRLGPETPWHISRFHPAYKMTDRPVTPVSTLEKALDLGKQAGLKYVYIGNLAGHKGNSTICPNCGQMLINRQGFNSQQSGIKNGCCNNCGEKIQGIGLN